MRNNTMSLRGLFITFEGGEGCGKTTQIQKFADHIESISTVPFVITREPGGLPAAELIREILVNGDAETWRPATEGLLMSAARHEHVEQIIRPALSQNKLVISDRFVDSTIVYQGIVGGVSADDIAAMNEIACGDIFLMSRSYWILTARLVLRVPSHAGMVKTVFEAKGHVYHEKVRVVFLEIAAKAPSRCVVIDANRTPDAIAADIWRVVRPHLLTSGVIVNE